MNVPNDTLQVKHLGHTVEVYANGRVPFGICRLVERFMTCCNFTFIRQVSIGSSLNTIPLRRILCISFGVQVRCPYRLLLTTLKFQIYVLVKALSIVKSLYATKPSLTFTLSLVISKLAVVAILFEVSFESIPPRLPWESLLAFANLNAKIPKVGDVTTTPSLDFASMIRDVAHYKVYR